ASPGENRRRHEFHSWFTLPKPSGNVVDEIDVSFEGALADWVSSYILLDDGRLLVLATETDFIDATILLASVAASFLAGITLVIILRIRRKRANARNSGVVTF